MRWTRQRFARDGVAGQVERLVSDRQRADERCCSVRRSRVVLTPRRWRQVCGVASAQPGLDKTYPQVMVANKPGSPGRARRKPLKPLRAGMPGDSGVLVVTRVRSTNTKCTRGRGCNGHPAFPTPSKGRELHAQLGRIARRGCEVAFGIGLLKIEPAAKYEPAIASAVAARERGCDLILRSAPWRASRRMVARVHGSCPSFETLASQAPQDEVGILHRLESGRSSIPRRE